MDAELEDRLDVLPIGGSATVVSVGGERPVARRLMEMGLLPGTQVTVVRVAPLGDPLVLKVRGYVLSIRRAEAQGVEIKNATVPSAALSVAPESGT